MKKLVLATALVSTLAFSSVQAGPSVSVPQEDFNQVFSGGIESIQPLSHSEMKKTEGEGWPFFALAIWVVGENTGYWDRDKPKLVLTQDQLNWANDVIDNSSIGRYFGR